MVEVKTKHPVAYSSPDHTNPWGTKRDNFTNLKFVDEIQNYFTEGNFSFMDLGCSGGQLVTDFLRSSTCKIAVGLEGSDYSVKHRRANWPEFHNKNLFTCDITEEFTVLDDGKPVQFDLITAWEVLEHIPVEKVPGLIENIHKHLKPGGIFACSISVASDKPEGVELHVTRKYPDWWISQFEKFGLSPKGDVKDDGFGYHYIFSTRVRGRKNGNNFWITFEKEA